MALDPQGIGIARTDRPLPFSADLSRVPTVAGALQGAQTEGIWLSGGKLYHVVGAPVLEGGTRVVGVIVAAFQINDEVARSLKTLTNAEAVFLADEAKPGEPPRPALAASTLQDVSAAVLDARSGSRPELVAAVLPPGQERRTAAARARRRHVPRVPAAAAVLDRPDRRRGGRPAQPRPGARGVPPDPEHADARRAARLVVAFVLSYVLAHRITGPVARLVHATEDVRVGNLESADLPVESKDEIGILARSFRAMLEELKEKAALEKYVASLTMNVGEDATHGRSPTGARSHLRAPGPRSAEPELGTLFAGRYEIQSVLGKGGMGIVYRAHDRELDDLVAIKTLRSDALSADPTLLDRFKQEIRLARRITHPNILRTHDLGETERPALSLDGVRQGDHAQAPRRVGPDPAHARRAADRQADLRGPRGGARGRRHPPRHQAAEHPHRADGRAEDHGLRHRAPDRGPRDDGDGNGDRHAGLHVARAGARASRSTSARTSTRRASSSTSSSRARSRSRATARSPSCSSTCRRSRRRRRRRIRRSTRKVAAIILQCMQKDPADRYQTVNELYEALIRVTAAAA